MYYEYCSVTQFRKFLLDKDIPFPFSLQFMEINSMAENSILEEKHPLEILSCCP